MTIFNNTSRIITFRDPASGKRYKMAPGANLNMPSDLMSSLKEHMKGHIEEGFISEKNSAPAERGGNKPERGGKAEAELAKVAETFDIDELKEMLKAAKSPELKDAIKAQIAAVKAV